MKTLIVHAGLPRSGRPLLPLQAHLLVMAARAAGHEAALLDLALTRQPLWALHEKLDERFRAVVLVTGAVAACDAAPSARRLSHLEQLAQSCHRARVRLILSGDALTESPEGLCRWLKPHFGLIGDAEYALPGLLDCLEDRVSPTDIPGLITVHHGHVTSRSEPGSGDLADLPVLWPLAIDCAVPAADFAAWPVETKRGCGFACLHCARTDGGEWRLRDPRRVAEELVLGQATGQRMAEIADASFGVPVDHAVACCEAISRRVRGLTLTTPSLHPRAATPRLLEAMEAASFGAVGVHAFSGSDDVLRRLQRGYSVADLRAAAAHLHALPARKLWTFRFGAPGETPETVRQTVDFMQTLPSSDFILVRHGLPVLPRTGLQRLVGAQPEHAGNDQPTLRYYYSPHVSVEQVEDILSISPLSNRLRPRRGACATASAIQQALSLSTTPAVAEEQAAGLHLVREALQV